MLSSDVKYAIGLSPSALEAKEFDERLDSVLEGFFEDAGIRTDKGVYERVRSYLSTQRARDATLFTFWRSGEGSKITSFYKSTKPEHKTLDEVLDQR